MLNINIKAAAARAVFMVISRELRNSIDQQLRFDIGHEHGKQMNKFAAHEQLRAAAACNRYEALYSSSYDRVEMKGQNM
jgi:hypothetical protein